MAAVSSLDSWLMSCLLVSSVIPLVRIILFLTSIELISLNISIFLYSNSSFSLVVVSASISFIFSSCLMESVCLSPASVIFVMDVEIIDFQLSQALKQVLSSSFNYDILLSFFSTSVSSQFNWSDASSRLSLSYWFYSFSCSIYSLHLQIYASNDFFVSLKVCQNQSSSYLCFFFIFSNFVYSYVLYFFSSDKFIYNCLMVLLLQKSAAMRALFSLLASESDFLIQPKYLS